MSLFPLAVSPFLDLAVVFLPLAGALVAGVTRPFAGGRVAALAATISVFLAALGALVLALSFTEQGLRAYSLASWIEVGALKADWALRLDRLSVLMMLVVSGISALVHLYSWGYMKGDKGLGRFMAYLSLFTFFMLMLVASDNLLGLFFGWEGVGLASYLLIGFWFEKPAASAAAVKAFVVNRVGDAGFLLGMFCCYELAPSLRYEDLFAALPQAPAGRLDLIALLLFLGAMGKSAQLGLHVWLPDAMEGPTPVSALIHAATMVAAGVFMVARLSPLFALAPEASAVVAVVGGLTALFAAIVATAQNDIKRVIAYSTISQLGFMFIALGLGAYGAAMFHLTTHACFKALLFLGAGAVIHGLGGVQDLRAMGGLAGKMKLTCLVMWAGALALMGIGVEGVGGFAGFYSKDAILSAALASQSGVGLWVYTMGLAAAFLTAFYTSRLMFLTFYGKSRAPEGDVHAHDAPWTMALPMVALAVLAVGAGFLFDKMFVGAGRMAFWGDVLAIPASGDPLAAAHELSFAVRSLPLVVALLGMGAAYNGYIRNPALPGQMAQAWGGMLSLAASGFRIDALYDRLFVRPAHRVGELLGRVGDGKIIDGLGPDGLSALTVALSRRAGLLETGHVYHYALAMVLGLGALIASALAAGYVGGGF